MIIDCHGHVASHSYFPRQFSADWAQMIKRNFPYKLSGGQADKLDELFYQMFEDHDCKKLLVEMELAGIQKTVLLIIDFGIAFKDVPKDIEQIHLEHKKIMEQNDKFIVFSGIDPRRGKEGYDLFEKAITQWGYKGLKLYPPCGFSPSDKMLFPYYEICQAYKVPVLTHIGPTIASLSFKYSQPIEIDEAARLFPGVNYIMGHAGVTHYEESSYIAQYRPNVYLDLSGFQGELKNERLRQIMKWNLSRGLSKKILFGTDWPIHRFFGSQKKWVDTIKNLKNDEDINETDLENIFYKNYKEILDF
jgi:predicted TIM-barrel fold metal-dependent hydrolase